MSSNRTQSKRKYSNGLGPQHFPVGTVFELNDDPLFKRMGFADRPWPLQFTVTGIVRNCYEHFILKTGVPHPELGEGMEHSYAISHVNRVIKRGTGPVLIEQGWYGFSGTVMPRKEVDLMALNEDPVTGEKIGRGFYGTGSVTTVVAYEISKIAKAGQTIATDMATRDIMRQSWTFHKKFGFMHVTIINKKRLKAFLRANLNRYLVDLSEATKENDHMMEQIYAKDWEDDWDSRHPELVGLPEEGEEDEEPPFEGSHFDNDDASYTYPHN